jgi:ATP-dependent exoDNAse (exonuclease V) beta subunit
MTATATPTLPRELVLASAGTGKTFRISSRIIGLLAAGAPAEAILASTFTRKAAGEILDRVLARLADAALDPRAAAELAEHAALAAAPPADPTPAGWLGVLRALVADLHRLNVGTLDALFVRTATTFADAVSLPPGWTIADQPTAERVRSEALHAVLEGADPGELMELVRALEAADAGRSVHGAVLRRAEELLALHHAIDPSARDAWDGLAQIARSAPAGLDARRAALAGAFRATTPPANKDGSPKKLWAKALADAAAWLEAGDWGTLIDSTLCRNSRADGGSYDRVEIPAEVRALLDEACQLARFATARRLAAQGSAMGRLARHLADAAERTRREMGAFEFGDLTRLVGGPDALCRRPDLHYRMDARVRHLLLDEFQDTSLAQWEAMAPLMDGLAADGAAVVVADPKQSIYAWRGGEPLLVRHVGDQYALTRDELSRSWRSSQAVLDAVNRVCERIEANPVFGDDEVARAAAAEWREAFAEHTAARDLPGHVRVEVGPADDDTGARPLLCRRAAERVKALRDAAPGRTIGVLTRRNGTVARIMLELRTLGIHASEEGGNPLTDSPAVAAVLALLRMADHPGDRVARFHVASTPVGRVAGVEDFADDAAVRRAARRVRTRLLEHGYGRTLEELARDLAAECSARDRRRMAQLVELGRRYDARATLRATDFVRLVEAERVEDPTTADVRVMTVHQSKGLEFDIVVLPELDQPLVRGDSARALSYRPHPTARVTRVFPYAGEPMRALFPDLPELRLAAEQAAAARWRDALSGLYVALTRARHALHILVKPDGPKGMGTAKSGARLVRLALAADGPATEGAVLHESGDPRWFDTLPPLPAAAPTPAAGADPAIRLAPSAGRRTLPSVAPSALAAPDTDLRARLRLDDGDAERGALAHAWLEHVRWIDDAAPADDELRAIAARVCPELDSDAVEAQIARFRGWLEAPALRALLHRAPGATVEREARFLHRDGDRLMEGAIDRLVLVREGGRVVAASVVDFKTDTPDRAALYRPQLAAYRAAVAAGYGLPPEAVTCTLVFLDTATLIEV